MRLQKILLWVSPILVLAQAPSNPGFFTSPITSLYSSDSTPNLDFVPKKKRDFKIKEKKIPRTVFYGVRTKRGFAVTGKGKGKVTELFYFIPQKKDPDPYSSTIYWFHTKKRKVMVGPIPAKDKKFARLLHGPYIKKMTYNLLEEGIFYMGTKHGRWEKYDKTFTLIDKTKYFRGYTRESIISYYDQDRKKIQEIMPINLGVKSGKYFRYFESGLVAEEGVYAEDHKVGNWSEYYDNPNPKTRKKKVTLYPKDPYDTETEPIVMKEWDENGKLIYDKASLDQMEKRKNIKSSLKQ